MAMESLAAMEVLSAIGDRWASSMFRQPAGERNFADKEVVIWKYSYP